jgi:hypothetical protein
MCTAYQFSADYADLQGMSIAHTSDAVRPRALTIAQWWTACRLQNHNCENVNTLRDLSGENTCLTPKGAVHFLLERRDGVQDKTRIERRARHDVPELGQGALERLRGVRQSGLHSGIAFARVIGEHVRRRGGGGSAVEQRFVVVPRMSEMLACRARPSAHVARRRGGRTRRSWSRAGTLR